MANIGHITDQEGEGILGPAGNLIAARIAEILFIVWVVLFVYFMVINFARRRAERKEIEGEGGFNWGWPLVLLILIVFIMAIKLLSGDSGVVEGGGEAGGGGGEIIPGSGGEGGSSYVTVIITLVIVAIIALTLIWEIRKRHCPVMDMDGRKEVRAMVQEAMGSLEAGQDPREVIYDSYLRMCRILERRGLSDISYMTQGEFASTAVREFHLPRYQVEELTSLVAFAHTRDLRRLMFGTTRASRKYSNIQANPRVALLIDNRRNDVTDFKDAVTVTAMGNAIELDGEEREGLLERYVGRHSYLSDFASSPTIAFIAIEVESYNLVSRFQKVLELKMDD